MVPKFFVNDTIKSPLNYLTYPKHKAYNTISKIISCYSINKDILLIACASQNTEKVKGVMSLKKGDKFGPSSPYDRLLTFVTVAEENSFIRAAVTLTKAGEIVFHQAKQILAHYEFFDQ